jgi:hypothetical protein
MNKVREQDWEVPFLFFLLKKKKTPPTPNSRNILANRRAYVIILCGNEFLNSS